MDENGLGVLVIIIAIIGLFMIIAMAIEDPIILLYFASVIAIMIGCYQLDNSE